MGQKTHPNGFRLITTQAHLSSWYNDKRFYKNSLSEDNTLRRKIESQISTFLVVSQIQINKGTFYENKKEVIEIVIHALFPTEQEMFKRLSGFLENVATLKQQLPDELFAENTLTSTLLAKQNLNFDNDLGLEEKYNIRTGVRKMLFPILREIARQFQNETGKILKIQIRLIENQFDDAHLVAKFIGEQLEQRVPFRRALNQALQTIEEITDKGVKIQISGRLNGNDIARSEWDLKRKVPLHTLKAKIDYACHMVKTSSGILGIKIWLVTP